MHKNVSILLHNPTPRIVWRHVRCVVRLFSRVPVWTATLPNGCVGVGGALFGGDQDTALGKPKEVFRLSPDGGCEEPLCPSLSLPSASWAALSDGTGRLYLLRTSQRGESTSTHTYAHTRTRTRTRTHSHTHTSQRAGELSPQVGGEHKRTRTRTHSHTRMHSHVHTHIDIYTYCTCYLITHTNI